MTLPKLENYGSEFQVKVISSLLTDSKFLRNNHDIISEEYFQNSAHKWVVKTILKYFDDYHTNPTLAVLKVELKKIQNEILSISIQEQLKRAYVASDDDLEYVQEEFENFCINQQLKNALLTSVDLLKNGDYDGVRTLINNALKAGQDKNIGLDLKKDVESRYREDSRKVLPFPWEVFNKITGGGFGGGDLVLIFGNPKGGKSWLIVAMAGLLVQLGYKIVFYGLELGEGYVGKRLDAYLTGIPVNFLDIKDPNYEEHRENVNKTMASLKGELIVKEYPPKRASFATIEAHLSTLDFKPDAIFIDYLDLLKPPSNRREKKDDLDDIYLQAKGLAKELNIPLISPSQANRLGAKEVILESIHIAGSYDKIMIGDIVISQARSRKDKLAGTARFHIMGNRYGPDGQTYFAPKVDLSRGYIEINNEAMGEDELENTKKIINKDIETSEKKFLKQEYDEFFKID